jgi:hypothetical protein
MKKIFSLIFLSILFSLPSIVNAQCVGGTLAAVRDTICMGTPGNLTLIGNTGSIQWQSSTDDVNFTNETNDTAQKFKTNPLLQSTWYRAALNGGTCFSDTLRLYVPPALVATFNFTQTTPNQVSFNSDSSTGDVVYYHWDFGDNQTSTEQNPVHTYAFDTTYYVCLTIYDGANCSYTFCRYTSLGNGGINVTDTHTNPTCGNSDGSINLIISGGTSPYKYLWNNNATTQNLNDIPAGTYNVTVTDINALTGNLSITLFNSNGPTISYNQTNANVLDSTNGNIVLNVSGGTSPYSFNWSSGLNGDTVSNLSPGNYTVTVTDANGCIAVQSFTIYSEYFNNFYVYVYGVAPNCNGNGSLSASVYGGNPQYRYLWSTGV